MPMAEDLFALHNPGWVWHEAGHETGTHQLLDARVHGLQHGLAWMVAQSRTDPEGVAQLHALHPADRLVEGTQKPLHRPLREPAQAGEGPQRVDHHLDVSSPHVWVRCASMVQHLEHPSTMGIRRTTKLLAKHMLK